MTAFTSGGQWIARFVLLSFMAVAMQAGHAQPAAAPAPDPDAVLTEARTQIDAVQKTNRDKLTDAQLLALRNRALGAQTRVEDVATALTPQLAGVQARLAELGTPAEGTKEAPDIAAQRTQLDKTRSALDAQIKLARLLSVEAEQSATAIWTQRRSQFQARLGERTSSILGPTFWSELRDDAPSDLHRMADVAGDVGAPVRTVPWGVWVGVVVFIAVLLGVRMAINRLLRRLTSTRVPPGRLRRSLQALTVIVLWTATPGLIAQALFVALNWNSTLSDDTRDLLASIVGAVWFSSFVAGLGHSLISAGKPSWRLPPIGDTVASSLRWFPTQFSVLIVVAWIAGRLTALVNASLATTVATNCVTALALGLCMANALRRFRRAQRVERAAAIKDDKPPVATPAWVSTIVIAGWAVLVASLIGLLVGYVAIGSFVINQMVWGVIVLAGAYLLAVLLDDAFMTLLASKPNDEIDKNAALPTPKARDQAAVLLSGVFRVTVMLFALLLLLAPFGEGPAELFRRADSLPDGLSIGEISIRPAALLQALAVLVLGIYGVRLLKNWLADKFLPTTGLDAGMRISATTLFGYAGSVVAIALAMSAVGIGLERVAWVASALSVGIGFGLQAVVQNFVSGIILLAERPVKVGDWVSLSGVEGDIRRINVRATEIQQGDRSTVIVPNSEFITKTVRNVTHANPIGLVQIKLPMPLSSDAEKVRSLMLEVLQAHEKLLDNPAPNVQLDGIEGGNLVFNATGFVDSPRASYGVKSELLFTLLQRLRDADLPLAKPPTMLLGALPVPDATPPSLLAAVPPDGPVAAPTNPASGESR
ncbi:MAG: mechanosensitive ion channel family protein [Rhizobacter sp.]|nr:mechanosensitive ion channel family protein [Rhizobacter sp.]